MNEELDRRAQAFNRAWLEFLRNFLTVSAYAISAAVAFKRPEWFLHSVVFAKLAGVTLYFAGLFASTAAGRLFVAAIAERFKWHPRMVRHLLLDIFMIILGTAVTWLASNSVH